MREKRYDDLWIHTWGVVDYGEGIRCQECNESVLTIVDDDRTTLVCRRCNLTWTGPTAMLSHYLAAHRRVTFPLNLPRRF